MTRTWRIGCGLVLVSAGAVVLMVSSVEQDPLAASIASVVVIFGVVLIGERKR